MTKSEAVAYFGSQGKLAAALGISRVAVTLWETVPPLRQCQLFMLTHGDLELDRKIVSPDALKRPRSDAATKRLRNR